MSTRKPILLPSSLSQLVDSFKCGNIVSPIIKSIPHTAGMLIPNVLGHVLEEVDGQTFNYSFWDTLPSVSLGRLVEKLGTSLDHEHDEFLDFVLNAYICIGEDSVRDVYDKHDMADDSFKEAMSDILYDSDINLLFAELVIQMIASSRNRNQFIERILTLSNDTQSNIHEVIERYRIPIAEDMSEFSLKYRGRSSISSPPADTHFGTPELSPVSQPHPSLSGLKSQMSKETHITSFDRFENESGYRIASPSNFIRSLKDHIHSLSQEKDDIQYKYEILQQNLEQDKTKHDLALEQIRQQNLQKETQMVEYIQKLENDNKRYTDKYDSAIREIDAMKKSHQSEIRILRDAADQSTVLHDRVESLQSEVEKYQNQLGDLERYRRKAEDVNRLDEDVTKQRGQIESLTKQLNETKQKLQKSEDGKLKAETESKRIESVKIDLASELRNVTLIKDNLSRETVTLSKRVDDLRNQIKTYKDSSQIRPADQISDISETRILESEKEDLYKRIYELECLSDEKGGEVKRLQALNQELTSSIETGGNDESMIQELTSLKLKYHQLSEHLQSAYKSKDELNSLLLNEKEKYNTLTERHTQELKGLRNEFEEEKEKVQLKETAIQKLELILSQSDESLKLKEQDAVVKTERRYSKNMQTLKDQLLLYHNEMTQNEKKRTEVEDFQRRERRVLSILFHHCMSNYISVKMERDRIDREFDASTHIIQEKCEAEET